MLVTDKTSSASARACGVAVSCPIIIAHNQYVVSLVLSNAKSTPSNPVLLVPLLPNDLE